LNREVVPVRSYVLVSRP